MHARIEKSVDDARAVEDLEDRRLDRGPAHVSWCGAALRSTILGLTPWRRSSQAANRPAGPAPTIKTSGAVSGSSTRPLSKDLSSRLPATSVVVLAIALQSLSRPAASQSRASRRVGGNPRAGDWRLGRDPSHQGRSKRISARSLRPPHQTLRPARQTPVTIA